jgi:basic membrane lipoprotein Med (substrate-binding protein (PBP1-ABC) superfamily)
LPKHRSGAQRASSRRIRSLLTVVFAALLFATTATASAPEAQAATTKVVIVVGPVGGATANYKSSANKLADQARSYGASVTKVYSPYATWSRVRAAAKGANLLIYLGHGNGWPSSHYPYSTTSKDGMGLNASYGNGNSNTKYYGEFYMATLALATNAVVVLNRLCYASGNNEWGAGNPTRSTAIKRVDNYGYGFLKAGAKAVFASGITNVGYAIRGLFKGSSSLTLGKLFWTDPIRTVTYRFTFTSSRTSGASAIMDPYAPGRYYRSVIGFLDTTVGDWRGS